MLRDYLDERIHFFLDDSVQGGRSWSRLAQGNQQQLWQLVSPAVAKNPSAVMADLLAVFSELRASQQQTGAVWRRHIPDAAWLVLILFSMSSCCLSGRLLSRTAKDGGLPSGAAGADVADPVYGCGNRYSGPGDYPCDAGGYRTGGRDAASGSHRDNTRRVTFCLSRSLRVPQQVSSVGWPVFRMKSRKKERGESTCIDSVYLPAACSAEITVNIQEMWRCSKKCLLSYLVLRCQCTPWVLCSCVGVPSISTACTGEYAETGCHENTYQKESGVQS